MLKKIDYARRKKVMKLLTLLKGIGAFAVLSLLGQNLFEKSGKDIASQEDKKPAYWS